MPLSASSLETSDGIRQNQLETWTCLLTFVWKHWNHTGDYHGCFTNQLFDSNMK